MEDDLSGILPRWKITSVEDNLNGRCPQWKTTLMEDDLNERRPQYILMSNMTRFKCQM